MMTAPPRTLRILLVDDEIMVLRTLQRSLAAHEVFAAEGYDEAAAVLERETLDLVISDCAMPGLSGVEVLRTTARLQPAVRRLMWSAHPPANLDQLLREGLIERYLPKPWVEELMGVVAAISRMDPR